MLYIPLQKSLLWYPAMNINWFPLQVQVQFIPQSILRLAYQVLNILNNVTKKIRGKRVTIQKRNTCKVAFAHTQINTCLHKYIDMVCKKPKADKLSHILLINIQQVFFLMFITSCTSTILQIEWIEELLEMYVKEITNNIFYRNNNKRLKKKTHHKRLNTKGQVIKYMSKCQKS